MINFLATPLSYINLQFNIAGWIKTYDEYYDQLTKSILNNMLHQLLENPDMTFIWAEISYFSRWYENLSSEDQNDVKTYVLSMIMITLKSETILYSLGCYLPLNKDY